MGDERDGGKKFNEALLA